MQETPHDERPGGSMPQPAEQHRQHQIAAGLPRSGAVATQRNIQIVAQPRREADVPAAPELARGDREIGKEEVLGQVKAHPTRHTAGDRRVT